jgi:phage nucleotide-binding protein
MPDTIEEIRSLWDMDYKVRALIYGDAGVGKTTFACYAPAPLLLDADGTGALSLYNVPELAMQAKVLQVRTFNQMLDVFQAYERKDERIADRETIIIDTLSNLQQKHLDEFIAKERRSNPSRDPVAYQRDYKFNTQGIRSLVNFFMSLDVNLVCLAHERFDKDEGTGVVKLRPDLTPALVSLMEGIFDVFGYMTSETDDDFVTRRSLQIMPSRRIKAKTRIGGLPPKIADPVFTHFLWAKEQMVNRLEQMRTEQTVTPYKEVAEPDITPEPVDTVQEDPLSGLVEGTTFKISTEPEGGTAA